MECAATLLRDLAMSPDSHSAGIADRLIEELGLERVSCLGDKVLVLGLKQSFANLATPVGEEGPMDHPTVGFVLITGPKCDKSEISEGQLCYFAKFSGNEMQKNNRRFFFVSKEKIDGVEHIASDVGEQLVRNFY